MTPKRFEALFRRWLFQPLAELRLTVHVNLCCVDPHDVILTAPGTHSSGAV